MYTGVVVMYAKENAESNNKKVKKAPIIKRIRVRNKVRSPPAT